MNIALIAHDAKKKLMQNFCIAYRGILSKNELYATGTTGKLVEEATNLNVHKLQVIWGESSKSEPRLSIIRLILLFSCGIRLLQNPMNRM